MSKARSARRTSNLPFYVLAAVVVGAVVVAGFLLLAPPRPPAGSEGIHEGNLARDFSITTIDGQTWTLSEQRGHPVVLSFMGANCSSCAYEARNALRPVWDDYRDRGMRMLSVDVNRATSYLGGADEQEVAEFAVQYGITWPIALDRSGVAVTYEATGNGVPLPTLLVIDGDGLIVEHHTGILSETDLSALLETLL